MLVAIAMDRHRAITRPLSMPGTPYKLLATAWLFSLVPSLPCLLIFKVESRFSTESSVQQPECVSDFADWPTLWRKLYFSGVAIIIFVIPLILFIGLYSHIVYELWATVNKLNQRVSELVRIHGYNILFQGWRLQELAQAKLAVQGTDQDNQPVNGRGPHLLVDQPSLHPG